jgi:predicted transcriptional regulator of viral defense system
MAPQSNSILKFVSEKGVTRASELIAEGFHSQEITRLVQAHELERLGRGLYALPQHDLTPWHDLAEVSKTAPKAVVCLVSALAFHEIGTHLPYETWIALPAGAWRPCSIPHLRVTYLSAPYYSPGIEEHIVEGVPVKIYCAAKTVADCFRMRSKVGYDVAVESLRDGWRGQKFTIAELMSYAKIDRVDKVMRPYIEALIS